MTFIYENQGKIFFFTLMKGKGLDLRRMLVIGYMIVLRHNIFIDKNQEKFFRKVFLSLKNKNQGKIFFLPLRRRRVLT